MPKTARIFHLVCFDTRQVTKVDERDEEYTELETLITEEKIKEALAHTSIKQWAYIHHTEDVYTDEQEGEKRGQHKPPHWHVVMRSKSSLNVEMVASWFGVPANFIDIPKGRRAFLDCVQYLTHESEKEQAKGKHLYEDEAVHASEGFDWRGELNQRQQIFDDLGYEPKSTKSLVQGLVRQQGKPLSYIAKHFPEEYNDNVQKLKALRDDYLMHSAPMPPLRMNFFVSGDSGMGKSSLSALLALSIFPMYEDWDEDEIIFVVGSKGVRFQSYKGQPIVIWEDTRAIDLVMEFGRGAVWEMFDPRPKRKGINKKNGETILTNAVHIVNGIETFDEFMNGLVGEYTDKEGNRHKAETQQIDQGFRRFPFFIEINDDNIAMWVNNGWMNDTREFQTYTMYQKIRGSFKSIIEQAGSDPELKKVGGKKLLGKMQGPVDEVREKHLAAPAKEVDWGELGKPMEIDESEREWHHGEETQLAKKRRENREKEQEENIAIKKKMGLLFDDDDMPY